MYYPRRRGRESEAWALQHLRARGLELITANFNCKAGEIDLIMRHRSKIQPAILVFVEVRYRKTSKFGGAAASVGFKKQQRLRRAAQFFYATHRSFTAWPSRFDVVAITGPPDNLQIAWLQSAFEC